MICPLCKSSLILNSRMSKNSIYESFYCNNCSNFTFDFIGNKANIATFVSESNKYKLCIYFISKLSIVYDNNYFPNQIASIKDIYLLDTDKNLDSQIEALILLS